MNDKKSTTSPVTPEIVRVEKTYVSAFAQSLKNKPKFSESSNDKTTEDKTNSGSNKTE